MTILLRRGDAIATIFEQKYIFHNSTMVLMFDISVDWPKNAKFCTHYYQSVV